ncbi:MAG TPA: tRNA epoxyqueuosine(34) reductase QueG [Geobacterales bacterium]|nr:tRNA epoxyqueuosine(34) reductase QueG [Geobacterales bacterium]
MQTSISEGEAASTLQPELTDWLKERVLAEGFEAVGIASPSAVRNASRNLFAFLEAGFHGDMGWLATNADRRADPRVLWPDVRSIVMAGMNYAPEADPLAATKRPSHAAISVYAQGADYHDVIKGKLKAIAADFAHRTSEDVKVFVDTAPVMEKPLAEATGIGWQGKHTNLVSRDFGSWLFLAAIFTTAELTPDAPAAGNCGSCNRCLDACPTRAFPAPYRLDARRCISYLTIEHKGQIPHEFRAAMGNRIYGCDDCLAVCPWNKFAEAAREMRFRPGEGAHNPPLAELLQLDDAQFRARFRGSPIKRVGRDRFVRNVLVAAGNSGNPALLHDIMLLLSDTSPLVRGMAVWASRRLADADREAELKERYASKESDVLVCAEWDRTP